MQRFTGALLRGATKRGLQVQAERQLFRWLTVVWNKVDEDMIKEMGAEAAAAQWLIRNGAKVKWGKNGDMFDDYDKLMNSEASRSNFISEIDATNSSITHVGFPYLKNLKSLRKIVFNETEYLEDKALHLLGEYQLPTLKHLEVIKCHDITDDGVRALQKIKTLNYLKLQGLSSVTNKAACSELLEKELTNCDVDWD